MSNIIIKMKPFIFEDGNIYFFEIFKRSSHVFHGIFVYKKVVTKKSFLFWKWEDIDYVKINDKEGLVDTILDTSNIKRTIKDIMTKNSVDFQLKDWDGFVGNIPEEVKKSIERDSKLNDLLG